MQLVKLFTVLKQKKIKKIVEVETPQVEETVTMEEPVVETPK